MIVECAKYFGLESVGEYDQLSSGTKDLFSHFGYKTIVRPLVERDRGRGLSWSQLSIKYGITVDEARWMICCRPTYELEQE